MKILVIEDETAIRDSLVRMLGLEGHDVRGAADGASGLALALAEPPDLVFSDVMMPAMDGYEVCRRLKADPATRHAPVIFVSGQESIDARLAGYDAGGEDFVVKPFQIAEILRKVAVAERIVGEARALADDRDAARRAAEEKAGILSDMGVVIGFMRAAFASPGPRQLAGALLTAVNRYGLPGAAQVRIGDEVHTVSAQGEDIPLEASILGHLSLHGRAFDFRDRQVHNLGGVTLLIHRMPGDTARRAQLGEYLGLLVEGAEARRVALEAEAGERAAQAGLEQAQAAALTALAVLGDAERRSSSEADAALADASQELARVFCNCGLAESQEAAIMDVVESQIGRLGLFFERHRTAVAELERIAGLLADGGRPARRTES